MKTLSDLLDEYLEWRRSLKLATRTIEKNYYMNLVFIRWISRTYQVILPDQIRKEHLYAWQRYIGSMNTKEGYPLQARTINTYIECIRGLFRYLADLGYIGQSLVDVVKYVKEPQRLPRGILRHPEVRQVLRKISLNDTQGYRDRAILELLYSSGLRASELLGLDMDDIDMKNQTIMVTGKGNKQRVVPVGRTALRYMETYMTAVRPYLLKGITEKAIFLNSLGKRLTYRTLLERVHLHAKRAGFDNVSPHTFRRSCTSELIRGNANMYHVKELLGHETLDTLKHYVKLTINDLKKTHQKCHPRERLNI